MEKQWQQQRKATALPVSELENYHLAQSRLQRLAARLDGLDERRGRYLTMLFAGSPFLSGRGGCQGPFLR
ncbi:MULTISPECIES: VasL domain-containing protein [Photorhabdus]|uniref:VasL domain-containing protein n=1 Tax=Photorhabdus TaxID=29487 RepID=UPI001EE6A08B|nr:VasL domain-containing protein [Photorhabdus thracensis]